MLFFAHSPVLIFPSFGCVFFKTWLSKFWFVVFPRLGCPSFGLLSFQDLVVQVLVCCLFPRLGCPSFGLCRFFPKLGCPSFGSLSFSKTWLSKFWLVAFFQDLVVQVLVYVFFPRLGCPSFGLLSFQDLVVQVLVCCLFPRLGCPSFGQCYFPKTWLSKFWFVAFFQDLVVQVLVYVVFPRLGCPSFGLLSFQDLVVQVLVCVSFSKTWLSKFWRSKSWKKPIVNQDLAIQVLEWTNNFKPKTWESTSRKNKAIFRPLNNNATRNQGLGRKKSKWSNVELGLASALAMLSNCWVCFYVLISTFLSITITI